MNKEFFKGIGMGAAAGAMIAMACAPSCGCHGHGSGKMNPKKKIGKFVKAVGGIMDDVADSMGM